MKKGFFITFDGPEGSGKSTHSVRLKDDLTLDGYDVIYTREPGGTLLGQKIRDVLLKNEDIKPGKQAELLLFEADRAQHVEEIIKPALDKGKTVICDRFNTATFAYQGYGAGMDINMIRSIDDFVTNGIFPDITLILDIEVNMGLSRAGKRCSADKMEKRPYEFHERVRQGYLDIAKKFPKKVKVIQVKNDIDETYKFIKNEVYDFIGRNKRSG
ncbi:MAG: dTMP kinase [Candidatus Omnitrophota bacterium]|nr:dTMP kinase [Candidatus Omnitrophota bacterium]MBU1894379.1 dTMP kinase [Candidatus Omnitrophota bacterium]